MSIILSCILSFTSSCHKKKMVFKLNEHLKSMFGTFPDLSSVIAPEADLRHHTSMLGDGRGATRWTPYALTRGLVGLLILIF